MLEIEGIDFELPQMGREPKIGYSYEYTEKTMISGKIRRIYKQGKRLYATFSYAFLTDEQISTINELLATQRQNGFLNVQISTAEGNYSGEAIIEVNNDQTRFKYDPEKNSYVWTNWSFTLKAVNL